MSCQGTQNSATEAGAQTRAFDAAFASFWPASLPFPPLTPWLAAAVSRAEAKQWAIDIGAHQNPQVLSGNQQAMLHVIGLAMGGGGAYEEARKGKKKKGKDTVYSDTMGCRCTSYQNGRAYIDTTECSGGEPHCCCSGSGPDVKASCSSQACPDWDRGGGGGGGGGWDNSDINEILGG